jgi:hypothetical protein
MDPAALSATAFAQTKQGVGKAGVYATLDANAAMAQLTVIEKMMLIRQVPIFAELDAEDLEELAQIVEERRIEAGRDVFKEGDAGDAVYLVVKGEVTVFTGGPNAGDGRPEKVLNTLGAGACIGGARFVAALGHGARDHAHAHAPRARRGLQARDVRAPRDVAGDRRGARAPHARDDVVAERGAVADDVVARDPAAQGRPMTVAADRVADGRPVTVGVPAVEARRMTRTIELAASSAHREESR